MGWIYAVKDAEGRIRYVGKTSRSLTVRFAAHIAGCHRSHLPFARWLNKHKAEAYIVGLEQTDDLDAREIWWIAHGRAEGWALLNIADGGQGGRNACSGANRGKPQPKTPEQIERWREARAANGWKHTSNQTAEAKASRSAAAKRQMAVRRQADVIQ